MSTQQTAQAFTELCRAGRYEEAGEKFWSDDVVSIEPMPGEMQRLEGRQAVKAKGEWWAANHEVHGSKVEGPFVNGDQFTLAFDLDVTPKGKPRVTMREHALFTVKDGKIVEERFFYGE